MFVAPSVGFFLTDFFFSFLSHSFAVSSFPKNREKNPFFLDCCFYNFFSSLGLLSGLSFYLIEYLHLLHSLIASYEIGILLPLFVEPTALP